MPLGRARPDRAKRRREPGGQAAQGGRDLREPACAQVPSPCVLRPGREVRLVLLGRPSPPRVLGLPPPAAVPSWRAYLCEASLLTSPPPRAGGEGAEPPPGNGEGASSPGDRPPSSRSRCRCCGAARGESGPDRRLLFTPLLSRPLPSRARPGAAAEAHVPARAARGRTAAARTAREAPGTEARGRGGSRGSPSAAARAPPAAGEGAGSQLREALGGG